MKRYEQIARLLATIQRCRETGKEEWVECHGERLAQVMASAPSGSGFDNGTHLIPTPGDRLKFETAFHHMTEHGVYNGWSEHVVIVRACLADGYTISVTGRDRNEIKDYIAEVFRIWLSEENTEEYQETLPAGFEKRTKEAEINEQV